MSFETVPPCEEQFGPALPVLKYEDVDDAVKRANNTQYGLGASVWGPKVDEAAEVAGATSFESTAYGSTVGGQTFSDMYTDGSRSALQLNISSEDFCNFDPRLFETQNSQINLCQQRTAMATVKEYINSFGATKQPELYKDDESFLEDDESFFDVHASPWLMYLAVHFLDNHRSRSALQTNISSEDFCDFRRRLYEIQNSQTHVCQQKAFMTTMKKWRIFRCFENLFEPEP